MSLTLPDPVAAYFAAANAHDGAAVAACFSADGVVADEGRQHRGRAAIVQWQQDVSARYQVSLAPAAVAGHEGGGCSVTARASGNFPGSPLDLTFRFSLAGQAITHLEIDA